MKPFRFLSPLSLLLGGLLFFTACDGFTNADADADLQLSAPEAAAAAEIVAQALSDAQEGTLSDLNDLNVGFSAGGEMAYGAGFFGPRGGDNPAARLWRGPNLRQRTTYNPETGEHTVSYERKVTTNLYEKALAVNLIYVFQTAGGAFVRFPNRQRDTVDAITFSGGREGSVKTGRPDGAARSAQFKREAQWQVTGLTTSTASFEGQQEDQGVFKLTTAGGEASEHTYHAWFQTENVTYARGSTAADLESALTGQMHYRVTMKRTKGDDTREKEVTGTITLEGNGQALLRMQGLRQLYRIDLRSGAVAEAG